MTEHDAIEQLAALLDGEPVRDAPSSLTALADLATTVQDHAELMAPTAEFRSALRAELVAAANAPPTLLERARDAWTTRTAHLRASARVAVATVTASSMIGSAGVAVAAQEALPGEFLHGLKSLTEDARLLLAVDGVAEARLHLEFARERLGELRTTAGRLDTDQVVALLAEMDAHSEAGAEVLLDGVPSGAADAEEIRRFTADQRAGLVSVYNDLPVLAKPVAEDSLELLRRIDLFFVAGDASSTSRSTSDATGRSSDGTASTSSGVRGSEPSQRTGTQDSGLDVTLGDHADVVSPEDCDCIELPGTTDDGSAPADDDTSAPEDTTSPDADEKSQQAPEDEPFEPADDLVVGDPGEQERDEDKRLDAPLSGDDLSRSEGGDTLSGDLATSVEPLVEADGQTLEQVEETADALLGE